MLCDIEGLSYEEISEVLDVKIGTVRSQIHRGRAQLRTALAHRRPTGERVRYLGVEVSRRRIRPCWFKIQKSGACEVGVRRRPALIWPNCDQRSSTGH